MPARQMIRGLKRFLADLRADARLPAALRDLACPACGGKWVAVRGSDWACTCRTCRHQWTLGDTESPR